MPILAQLPPEVLLSITNGLYAHSIGLLWLSGDRGLQNRLGAGGGVQKFCLVLDNIHVHGWPNLVAEFPRLQTFNFLEGRYYHSNSLIPSKFHMLPQNLRAIKVDGDAASTTLLNLLQAEPALFPLLESLTTCIYEEYDGNIDDLETRHALRELSVRVASLNVSHLPQQLKILRVKTSDLYQGDATFPPGLKTLELEMSYDCEFSCAGLPSGLEELILPEGRGLGPEEVLMLPKSLNLLHAAVSVSAPDLAALPPLLTSLSVGYTFERTLNCLPRALTEIGALPTALAPELTKGLPLALRRMIHIEQGSFIPESVNFLPAGFTTLQVAGSELDQIRQFPNHLESLIIPALPLNLAKLLPQTLRMLEAYIEPEVVPLLPPALKILSCYFPLNVDLDVIRGLPRGLFRLSIGSMAPTRLTIRPTLDLELAEGLPRNLISLSFQDITIEDPLVFGKLPNTLQTLNLNCSSLPKASMEHAPKSLRTVYLRVSNPLAKLADALLSTMPKHVSSIRYGSPRGRLSDDGLRSLPPALMELIVDVPCDVTDKINDFIPKDLGFAQLDGMVPPWGRPKQPPRMDPALV